ncbi:MAG: 5-dehydro-4-deoxyglucarate dehydratase [Pseudolabrys sp.]|nr:5-dehydro-4-deoxyglucarate dehydratase [Pseudolabrys sp.]MBV9954446.1 5-dehydro-4-deoxyglucarate dehydratase [Pseudolabrys sp.]
MPNISPQELKSRISSGLMCFPLTDFDAAGNLAAHACARRFEWLASFDTSAFVVAGGAGEFFSLSAQEYVELIATAVRVVGPRFPVIAGVGYGTRMAIALAQEAEQLGADGLLLMPPYLTEGSQAGLVAHIGAVCAATRLGVVVYNRANCRLNADSVAQLARLCPNLIGFKDGVGDLEQLVAIRTAAADRLAFFNGMPTAETFAPAFKGIGIPVYSSAIFNFVPRTALRFHKALNAGDDTTVAQITQQLLVPYVKIRGRQPGYAVSIVKAGARIVGRDAGPVRPPLSDLTRAEYDELAALIAKLGPQS